MTTINSDIELKEFLADEKPIILDFYADWCSPCRAITPVLETVEKQYAGQIKIGKINVDNLPQLATAFGINSIPNLIFVKNKTLVNQLKGLQAKKEITQQVEGLLKETVWVP